ncbi:MAG: peptide-methionine (R)-S-oxide reductase MsrB [Bacteriovoracaceae bacterium]|jgi:peptide-methionine (R)-S-oxide reductase|nr:peptide-methionine (R)-S-oxide reductase MsrB [Bacteriovoracaceae bacterium]
MDQSKKKKNLEQLSPEAIYVTQHCGTEPPFSGKYNSFYEDGLYLCAVCDHLLFDSKDKFDSGSGWPSFFDEAVELEKISDSSHGMQRIELRCPVCHAHLGHVFTDGPKPTGLRYCINSLSLKFQTR